MTDTLSFLIGLAVLVLVRAACVKRIIERASAEPTKTDVPTGDHDAWIAIATYRSKGGRYIGNLESLLFYTVFILASEAAELVIAGYLAFKVASKWEVWGHVYRVPDEIKGIDPTKYLHFRVRWGSYLFDRFLIGTLLSLLTAAVAVVAERYANQALVYLSVHGFIG